MPTAEQVTARLREMARLSREYEAPPKVDMSAEAITARLREMGQLSRLCAQLGQLGASRSSSGRK